MKFYSSQLNELFKKIKNNVIKGLLLYGPDKGYISEICELLIKELDLLSTIVSHSNFNARELEIMLNSRNFFAKKELVKVNSIPVSFNQEFKALLKTEFINFIVFIGDEVALSSEIRKYFETEQHLASVACYYDDEQAVVKLILKSIHASNKTITTDALDFLKLNLKGDHGLIINEINKLLGFVNDKSQITIDDVTKAISLDALFSLDDLCSHFACQDLESFLNELAKLKQQNINEVIIIRSLIKYYLNMYIVLSKTEQGQELGVAVKSLTPPIFFKYAASFTAAARKIRLSEAMNIISILQRAEVEYKLSPHNFDFNMQIYSKAYSN